MAKRKAARAARRRSTRKVSRATTRKARATRKKTAARTRKSASRKTAARGAKARVASKPRARRRAAAPARTASTRPARHAAATRPTTGSRAKAAAAPARARAARTRRRPPAPRKPPALERERRVLDETVVQSPPSTLDLDRTASAVRTGRRELRERYDEHTETSPALTAGDIDANWESAYSVGDEAPGGDNPTPDQDVVEEIGRAVGIEYQDNEELKGAEKVEARDRHRWELDPASSEDWGDR